MVRLDFCPDFEGEGEGVSLFPGNAKARISDSGPRLLTKRVWDKQTAYRG